MRTRLTMLAVALASAALVLGGVGISAAVGGPAAARAAADAAGAAPRPADVTTAPTDSVLTPITPCRIVDTRKGGGRLSGARAFYVAGVANFPAQGGASNGCGIPASATAVSADIVATQEVAEGYLKAYPAGASAPTASVLNYTTVTIANGITLAVRPGTDTGLVVSSTTPTQVIVDITAYYAPQVVAYVQADGSLFSGSGSVRSVAHTSGSGYYNITVDRDVTLCSVAVTAAQQGAYAEGFTGTNDSVYVRIWKLGSTTAPVNVDADFNLTVSC